MSKSLVGVCRNKSRLVVGLAGWARALRGKRSVSRHSGRWQRPLCPNSAAWKQRVKTAQFDASSREGQHGDLA
jgi:hypothetical protein